MNLCIYFNLKSSHFIWKTLLIFEKTLLEYPAQYKKTISSFSLAYKKQKTNLDFHSSSIESQQTEVVSP